MRVGIITNDQADELVDTVTLEGQGFAVEQVAGACFCCHFNALIGGPGQVAGRILDLDYDRHARGEAELGWLNCRVMVISDLPSFSLDELLEEVASTLGAALERRSAEIAHLKISGRSGSYLGLVNLVDRRQPGELSIPSGGQVHDAELTINARVAIDPAGLERQVVAAVEEACLRRGLRLEIQALRSFRPGRPVPVHRFVSVGDVVASS